MAEDRYVFLVQWFDTAASLVRVYNFTYYLKDKAIEMFDIKNKRIFLKRCEYPNITLKDIFIGATLTVYSRQLKVIGFADEFTQSKFTQQRGKLTVVIKPDSYLNIGKIINAFEEKEFTISHLKIVKLNKFEAQKYYSQQRNSPYFNELVEFITSDLVMAVEFLGDDCHNRCKQIVGASNPADAKKSNPNSIRALYGKDSVRNAVEFSENTNAAIRDRDLFFSDKSPLTSPAQFTNCSCLIIKPHLINEGYVGQVLDSVLVSKFEVSAAEMFWLDRPSAEQFLEVYKGVVPEYNQLVQELTNGPCIAVEVRQEDVVTTLRQLCGPHDPDMARTVRPKSLRATYGKDKGKNGVHCTDLEEDGVLEVEYFFNILQRK